MSQLQALSVEKPNGIKFKTAIRGHYGGDTEPYVKNYSHRNVPLKRDPRVVINGGAELQSDSHLQVAPHSRKFINAESL